MDDEPIAIKEVYNEIIRPYHTSIMVLLMFAAAVFGIIYITSTEPEKIVEQNILQESLKDLLYYA